MLAPGSIVLFHDDSAAGVAALERLIPLWQCGRHWSSRPYERAFETRRLELARAASVLQPVWRDCARRVTAAAARLSPGHASWAFRAHIGDLELVSATPEEFAWQLEYLPRRFEPVTFDDIARALAGEISLPPALSPSASTMASRISTSYAWPALRRAGMPATVSSAPTTSIAAPLSGSTSSHTCSCTCRSAPSAVARMRTERFPGGQDADRARAAAASWCSNGSNAAGNATGKAWLEDFRLRFRETRRSSSKRSSAARSIGTRSAPWRRTACISARIPSRTAVSRNSTPKSSAHELTASRDVWRRS